METQQLRYFVAVTRARSFSAAATQLNVSQPALSRSIGALEASLGVRLFDRTPGGVEPNAFGRTLLETAETILADMRRAREAIETERRSGEGVLRIGASPNFEGFFVPDILNALLQRRPRLRVIVHIGLLEELAVMVRLGQIEAALAPATPQSVGVENVQFRSVLSLDFQWYVRSSHPAAQAHPRDLEDLADYDWATVDQADMDMVLRARFANSAMSPPRQRIRSNSVALLKEMVLKRDLVAVLPEHMMRAEVEAGAVVALTFERAVPAAQIYLLTSPSRALTRGAEEFVRLVDQAGHGAALPGAA